MKEREHKTPFSEYTEQYTSLLWLNELEEKGREKMKEFKVRRKFK